jgi:predicted methyltransferase
MQAWAKVTIVSLVAVAAVASAKTHPAAESQKAIAAALANPARADQATDDDRRKTAAVLAFSGVGPGDTVVDFFPGAGYWTRIFSGVVGPKGQVISLWPSGTKKYAEKAAPAMTARGLANVTVDVQEGPLAVSKPVDLVWTVQNYHDINNVGGEAAIASVDAAIFKMLKPGGTYVVIDHVDAAASGLSGTATKHRIDAAVVKAQVLKAGFKFAGESNVLRNPADDHKLNVFDPAIRGHTDQFVYKFRKPG